MGADERGEPPADDGGRHRPGHHRQCGHRALEATKKPAQDDDHKPSGDGLWAGGGIFGHSVAAAMIINSVL